MSLIILYVTNMLGYMLVALPFYIIGRIVFVKRMRSQVNLWRELVLGMFVLYMVGLASQTIIPQWSAGILAETGEFYFDVYLRSAQVNLIPFRTLNAYFFHTYTYVDNWNSVSLVNIIGNSFLFSPIGFLMPCLWKRWQSLKRILWIALGVTCTIEFIQLFIGRSTDIDDVILNTVGVMLGYGLFAIVHAKWDAKLKRAGYSPY
ncbi:glycopeptide antibiotics resistance protein [Lederbergia galactosidilyticus]|nr:VanZ family protein [Lederbergia galactosidilytica]MBP1915062.1 glycopeptide antibiotics resistance protein [Lederbergia galactosidilytica]